MNGSPITFEVAARIWGDPEVSLADDATREVFFSVWAWAIVEFEAEVARERTSRCAERGLQGWVRKVLRRALRRGRGASKVM